MINQLFFNSSSNPMQNILGLRGINLLQLSALFRHYGNAEQLKPHSLIFVTQDDDEAELVHDLIQPVFGEDCGLLPSLGVPILSSLVAPESDFLDRWQLLSTLSHGNRSFVLVTSLEALFLSQPDPSLFQKVFYLKENEIFPFPKLRETLAHYGYITNTEIDEIGTFFFKGEILDIHTIDGKLVRVQFFDELIESIHEIDPITKRSLNTQLKEIRIAPSPRTLLKGDFPINLRKNIPQVSLNFKRRYDERVTLFDSVMRENLFDDYPKYISHFFEKSFTILDYFNPTSTFVISNDYKLLDDSLKSTFEDSLIEHSTHQDDADSHLVPNPAIAFNKDVFSQLLKFKKIINVYRLSSYDEVTQIFPTKTLNQLFLENGNVEGHTSQKIISLLQNEAIPIHTAVICAKNQHSIDDMSSILKLKEISSHRPINYSFQLLTEVEGFYVEDRGLIFITENDLSQRKGHVTKKSKRINVTNSDLFAEQFNNLKAGDFVIHRDFGVGIYNGLKHLDIGGTVSDFIEIIYKDNDKVFVPVYKINLVQKYADVESPSQISDLKTRKYDQAKERVKSSVKKLAFDLLKLQAERHSQVGFQFSPPDKNFLEFEVAFPYDETPDQFSAIQDVISDMESARPMDRLVCGDVGFGKTEVAMRAAFKAVLDKKQVAILVPTTVLAIQHYYTFVERFKSFPVTIDVISRLKSAKELSSSLERIANGKLDIVIGTHKLLGDSIKYHDLGLVIVDEEHRFGVGHKEKLKLLKANIDFLTLSATPIPRTLQQSFLGIKDLSTIKTPPPRRQSVKTMILKEDYNTLRIAIESELARNGQIFFVHNRIFDLDDVAAKLKKLVPSARIITTHGQMVDKEMEKRILSFFNHEYDILVTTTIIESGIDVPRANTLIVDRADTYGLAQLHQLRGRIGRSDRKAYAYFIIPADRNITPHSLKRLQALETHSDIGSGFALSNVDLEIRGAGDILGPEQSGHIKSVGLESYMYLLQEAINDLKGEVTYSDNIEVQSYLQAFLPESYIENEAVRLKYYKRLSNTREESTIQETLDELNDQFGTCPEELINLTFILRSRLFLSRLFVSTVRHSNLEISIRFDEKLLALNKDVSDKMIKYFLAYPKKYKFKSSNSVSFSSTSTLDARALYEFSKHIVQQILP